jgi:hypothetical protein
MEHAMTWPATARRIRRAAVRAEAVGCYLACVGLSWGWLAVLGWVWIRKAVR